MFGFYRLAAAVPKLAVADVAHNLAEIAECYRKAAQNRAAAVVFPELCLSAYSCGDLFFQPRLQQAAEAAAVELAKLTAKESAIMIFGLPFLYRDRLYNVAAVASGGEIRALVPKKLLPDYREFYEKRQFSSGAGAGNFEVPFGGGTVRFCENAVFEAGELVFGVEICEDLWGVAPPSSQQALAGAKVLFNLSAGTELAGKADYRRALVAGQSGRCLAAYVMAAAGVHESTTDAVFGGHALIGENGRIVTENRRFDRQSSIIYADVDLARLGAARLSESSFNDNAQTVNFEHIKLDAAQGSPDLNHARIACRPFVPDGAADRAGRCREIFDIQCAGLAKRWEHTRAETLVIGVSGGLDSTLALLVCSECCKLLGRSAKDIVAVTMPGFGTTGRTRANAGGLAEKLGATLLEIDIRPACNQHFEDIGHDPGKFDTVFENVQARERTQILMDIANARNGLVIGTGDLSEIALGWSTYNGDHMSMYAVNCSIPKSLVRYLIAGVAEREGGELAKLLLSVIDTPVSPELLPAGKDGQIVQRTEELSGVYELHDFFLYHFLKYGAEPEKLLFLAGHAFGAQFSRAEIVRTLKLFLKRFFTQQFKRSCLPDGPKVGTISLSPRADWRMPSDASWALWELKE